MIDIDQIKAAADCRSLMLRFYPNHFREHGNSLCPFHEDCNPSLQVSKEFAFCHAETKSWDAIELYREAMKVTRGEAIKALGEEFGLNGGGASSNQKRPQRRIVRAYDYRDEEGTLLFQVVRFDPKEFRQRRPDGSGGWIWNLDGVDRVLYRLPEIKNADEVFIVEGEKDADRLTDLGLAATTCPQGAGKWRPELSVGVFKGKKAIIIPDNDEPGKKHMMDVARTLYYQGAASVKAVELPGLPPKGDVTNWLENGGTRDDLLKLVAETPEFTPERSGSTPSVSYDQIILEDYKFIALEIPAKRTLLHPWLTEQSISLIVGWRGVGKTWFALLILDAVTRGVAFGPWEPGIPIPCLYLDGEMACSDVIDRISLIGTANRKSPLYIYSDAYAAQLGLPKANLLDEDWRTGMKKILLKQAVKLWVVDNIASLSPGADENSRESWDPINQWLLELRFAGISTILLHHEGKEGRQRGTSAREDNIDISLTLEKPRDYVPEDGGRFIAHFTKHRIRTIDLPKIAKTEFRITSGMDGGVTYEWGDVKKQAKVEILKMLDRECTPSEIVDVLGVSKAHISQTKNRAIKDGLITPKGKLTQRGYSAVCGENFAG